MSGDRTIRVAVDLRCLDDPRPRGFGRYATALLDSLAEHEPSVELIGFATRFGSGHRAACPFPTGSELVAEQWRFPRAATQRGAHVIWCPANRGLPLLSPLPTVLTLHDAVEWDRSMVPRPSGRSGLRFAYSSAASIASAAAIITPSATAAGEVVRRLHVDPALVHVVHEGAAPCFAPVEGPRDAEVLAQLGVARPYLLYVGGFDDKKDVGTLLEAAHALTTPLVLVGDLERRTEALRQAAPPTARWLGRVDDSSLAVLYRHAVAFAFPALAEGFGLPPVEAMASGAPVVVARTGSLPEVVADGGVLVEPRSPLALAAALRSLLNDPRHRDRMVAAALRRASQLSWAAAAHSTAAVLRDVAAVKTAQMIARRARSSPAAFRAAVL